jgi:hypothetical protein
MKMGEAKIDGKTYQFGFWDVDTSTEYLVLLFGLLGETLATAMLTAGSAQKAQGVRSMLDVEMNEDNAKFLSEAIKSLTGKLNHADTKRIIDQCLANTLCDGKKVDKQQFMGKIGVLLRVVVANLRHQYADFLGGNPVL